MNAHCVMRKEETDTIKKEYERQHNVWKHRVTYLVVGGGGGTTGPQICTRFVLCRPVPAPLTANEEQNAGLGI